MSAIRNGRESGMVRLEFDTSSLRVCRGYYSLFSHVLEAFLKISAGWETVRDMQAFETRILLTASGGRAEGLSMHGAVHRRPPPQSFTYARRRGNTGPYIPDKARR